MSCAVALAAALSTALLHGSTPKFFQAATQADFLEGELESLSIDSRGQLTLGAASELVFETAAPFLWSMAPGPDGSLFVGTGNEGKVFRIDAGGRGSVFFDAMELEAHALAPAPDGGLYVGTSPDGKIYKVDRRGTGSTFFEPGEKYIWAMASDARGQLYVATGSKGQVYRVAPNGTGAAFYKAEATNVTALAIDRAGNLLIGTDAPGRVLRVDSQGKAFLLLDTPFEEIRSLRFDEAGALYVAAVNGKGGSSAPPRADDRSSGSSGAAEPASPTPVVSVSTEITAIAVVDTGSSASASPREDRRSIKGAVYRIAPDGLWDKLWESREDTPYDVTFDAQKRLVIATGNKGKLYRLEGDPLQPSLIATAGGQQVTALHRDGSGRVYYATANPGKVYRLSAGAATKGTYLSEAQDAGMVASWGAISWRAMVPASGRLEISTRSGNSETPNDTWSEWSAPYAKPEGSPIQSPKARYLQWRAVLSGSDTPVLTSLSAAYLQRNLRPQVQSITVHPPGIVFQKPYSTGDPDLAGFENQTTPERKLTNAAMTGATGSSPALGRKTYQQGLQTIVWRAADENEDELVYDVRYRREGETTWKTLKDGLAEPILVWDTSTVPNGTYIVRISASDSPSNPSDTALTGESDSQAFEIDNAPPRITGQNAQRVNGRTTVSFAVSDEHSPIQKVECSLDGIRWRTVFPADGMADSREERYQVEIEEELGARGLSVRAIDALNNTTTIQVEPPRTR
ncbi:MAG: hypothetical protein AB7I13_04300 [Vicinamibacterales bacterium]